MPTYFLVLVRLKKGAIFTLSNGVGEWVGTFFFVFFRNFIMWFSGDCFLFQRGSGGIKKGGVCVSCGAFSLGGLEGSFGRQQRIASVVDVSLNDA